MPWNMPGTSSSSQFFTLPFRRKRYTINPPDDSYNVVYLGNVLTVLAKGDGCVDKPLALIWKTYCSRTRPDLHMKLAVTRSGLKAETKQQGLTEYWAHRITYCVAPTQYPRVFCWVYKHEGKRMKPELRCHAVLCRKLADPVSVALRLHAFLQTALAEYKREKIATQNTRLYGTVTGMTTCPRRKQLLHTGTLNFRPPVSRSKSAPRLGCIDEDREAEEEESQLPQEDEDVESLCYAEDPLAGDLDSEAGSSDGGSSPFLRSQMQIDIGVQRLNLVDDSGVERRRSVGATVEPDSVSDESGYHEEKSSLENEGDSDGDEDEPDIQVTAL